MLEVKIPADVRVFKGRHMGLTTRNIISIAGSLAVGIPLGIWGSNIFPADLHMWAVILSVSPIIAWGFLTFKGMRFEELVVVLFKFYFLPQKRVYEDCNVNYFEDVRTALTEREIMRQRVYSGEIDDEESEGDNYVQ